MTRQIKILILCLAAVLGTGTTVAGLPQWGARLSMDVSLPTGSGNIYKVGSGVNVGATAKWQLPKNFFVEPGLMFYYMSMTNKGLVSFDNENLYEGNGQFMGIRVPINFGYTWNLSPTVDMDVFTGPTINFNLYARQGLQPNMAAPDRLPDSTIDLFHHGWKRVDASWGFGLSFTFMESYYVGLSGGVSFTPMAKYGDKDKKIRIHRNSVAITLGYNF